MFLFSSNLSNDADGRTTSVDPAPSAVLSGTAVFTQAFLSIQSNFNGSETFGTMKTCSRQG